MTHTNLFRFTIIAVFLSLTLLGCSSGSQFWLSEPTSESRVDSFASFAKFRTFTIIPYSGLASDAVAGGRDENAMMFALANILIAKGFHYVDKLDSADFIVTERISDDYDPNKDLKADLNGTLDFKSVTPFSLISSSFGDERSLPNPAQGMQMKVYPKIKIIIFDGRTHRILYRWVEGASKRTASFLHISQHFLKGFARTIQPPDSSLDSPPVKTGQAGFNFVIWSREGINFWPEIVSVVRNSPADFLGVRQEDVLIEVNGISLKNHDYNSVLSLLSGDAGKTLYLKIWRGGRGVAQVSLVMSRRAS